MRRNWSGDYEERLGPGGRPSFVYKGARFALPREGRRAYAMRVLPPLLLSIAALAAMGLIDTPGSRTLYVALPWAALLFPAGIGLYDLTRLILTRRALTARDHASSAVRFNKSLAWLTALSALLPACDLLFLVLNGFSPREDVFFSLSLVNLALSLTARLTNSAIVWKEIPPVSGS